MKQKFILVASLAVGLLAAVLARVWLDSKANEVARYKDDFMARQGGPVWVMAATHALPQGTVLKMDDLGQVKTYRNLLTADNILEEDGRRLLGRRLTHAVDAKAPILWTYVDGGREQPHRLADEIQQGMRAVSIPVSGAAAVSGLVRPNDHVDVLGMFALPGSGDESELVTLTVLQNATVLATGAETGRSHAVNGERAASSGYSTVTLQVMPREAEVLVFAQQMKGRLFLSLRNPSDVHFEPETPRVDFGKIEAELKELNELRQQRISSKRRTAP